MSIASPLTSKQEAFCRFFVENEMTARDAAKAAGYSNTSDGNIRSAASQLLTNINIKTRIEQLRREAVYKTTVTVVSIAEDIDRAWKLAFIQKKPEACIAASMAKAKLFGFVTDRPIVDLTIINKPLAQPTNEIELSVSEWQERWAPKQVQ